MAEHITPIGGFSAAGAEKLREMAENSAAFAAYLKFHGRMFKHSPSVTLEFYVQRPESRYVASQMQWEKAGKPIVPDSDGIRFRDSKGSIVELYDFSQCVNQKNEPYQWRMTEEGEAAVRAELALPADQAFLTALMNKTVSPESMSAAMERLHIPPQDARQFGNSFRSAVITILAGRMEVGGNSFPVQVDDAAFKNMNEMQRLGFITAAAVSAKHALEQVETVMNDRRAAMGTERMNQDELRRISELNSSRNAADSGRRTAGSAEGNAAQLPDTLQSDAEGRQSGLGNRAGSERKQQDILSADAETEENRQRDVLVSGESDNRDIRNADGTGRTVHDGGTGGQLRDGMDAMDGGESPGTGRGNKVLSPVSDGSPISRQESMGVSNPAGQTVHGSESPSARIREDSAVGTDADVLHGQRDNAGHHSSGSHNSVNKKIAQAFSAQASEEKPITSERRAVMLAAFASKHKLDGLSVFVKQDKSFAGDGRAYDILMKNGRKPEFHVRLFTLDANARFTESALQSGLDNLEKSAAFQEYLSFRQGQHSLFEQPEPEKVDTSSNSESEMDAETLAVRQREIDKAIQNMQHRLERADLTPEKRLEFQDMIAFFQSADAAEIEITSEAMNAFRAKRSQERDELTAAQKPETDERRQMLLDDLGRGSQFVNGKFRISDFFEKNQPTDAEFGVMLREEYGIGGHSGPEMPSVDYDSEGIHIVSADRKSSYQYTWTQAAKEIRKMIEQDSYITAADVANSVDHALYYLQEVEQLDDHERDHYTEQLKKLRSHPLLSDSDKARIDGLLQPKPALELSPAAKYIMDEDNMPMFVDRMVARDEMDEIAHRILDNGEDAATVAQEFVDASRYIISDHETFDLTTFAAAKDDDGVTFTAEPDSLHPFSVLYSWEQIGGYFRAAAQLKRDVDREAEEAIARDRAENKEAYDALDHHRDVYLRDTRESENALNGYITNARKQDFYNYRLHFEPDKGYLLLADSEKDDDLILRNFTMVGSHIVLHGVQEMGFEVESVEPAFTYEIYQMKSGEEHHYHRFESLETNKYAHLNVSDYNLVYSGDLREIGGDTIPVKLDMLFRKFNEDHPADFTGHSMSVSDVIVVTEGDIQTPYYVQPTGFEPMYGFLKDKLSVPDIEFAGNPDGFNAIKVAARTDSVIDTGSTNIGELGNVFSVVLSEKAVLEDVQKLIQTAHENGCYLLPASVEGLMERFGADFMPELPVDTVFQIPETNKTVDLSAVGSFTMQNTYGQYEGGTDSDGHERRDNFSKQTESYTVSYRGNGIVETTYDAANREYPSMATYNIYDAAQREKLEADIRDFAEQADMLQVSGIPEQPVSEWSYYIVADLKTWSQNESPRSELERYDTLDAAISRFNELRVEAYNSETVFGNNPSDLPLARLTMGIRHSSGKLEFDLIHVRGGQNYLNMDFSRHEQARDNQELQDTITAIAEWCGIDMVLDYQTDTNGNWNPVTMPFSEWQQQEHIETESMLQFGMLGNGITVYDTARTEPHSHDYLTVAHISDEGNATYYAEISDADRKRIEEEAARQHESFAAEWNAKSDAEKLLTIMQRATPAQVVTIAADHIPADQLIAKYEKSIIFRSEQFPAEKAVHLVITNAGSDGGIDDKKEYTTLGGAIQAGRAYITDGYEGFAVYNQDTKQIEHHEGIFPLSRAFNPEILRLNGMEAEAAEAEREMRPKNETEPAEHEVREEETSVSDIITPAEGTSQETDTADTSIQAEPAEKEKKRGRLTRPEELYKLISEMFPQLTGGERTHEHYEADENSGYEPLSVEKIGDGLYSFMTYYIQNGDMMRDPDITFTLDHDEKTARVFSFQQDGVPPYGTYCVEVADENGNIDTKLQASLEQTFLQNLKNAQAADRTLTRYHDKHGDEVILVPDADESTETETESAEPVNADENAHLRETLNAFSAEYGLGELNLRFTAAHQVTLYETYADGSEKELVTDNYWEDNEQISPEECKKILDNFVAREQRRGRRVEDANGRKFAVATRGKSELPPVPDDLPEIVYAKAPLQKVRDNITAIRELQRLARCEMEGRPLYDKRRNQWDCKENSDERLRKYSGWGGLQQVFDAKSGRYADLRIELQKLLTQEEYASAKASATDAHYTPQIVIDAMYQAIQNMGISRNSRVLEPACGTGNFITRMPHSIGNGGVVGIELDDITAQIAKRLNAENPNVTIMHSAFEQSGQTDSSFDLAIGNIPFGDYKMNDPDYTQDWLIHDAFFRKALDKVAAGGVVAFVTSTGTMDKKNPKVREYLAAQADLIGAIRLPNNAFSDAGTGVPTDIIFLQKRTEPLSPDAPKPDWCFVTPISQEEPDIRINSYYVQNPQMMLGTMRKTSFQDRLTCDPIAGADLKKQLELAVKQLNAKLIVTKRAKAAQERRGFIQPWGKQYTYQEKDGKIYYNEGTTMREVNGSAKDIDRLKRLIELRTVIRQLIDKQKTSAGDHELVSIRLHLNRQYDDFVAKYGQLNMDAVKKAFGADADFSLLQSLEDYDADSKTYIKAEIFTKRTVNPVIEITAVETLEEAYQVSLDRRGKPDIPYMATLLQDRYPDTAFSELMNQVQKDLLEQGMIFIDPEKEVAGEPFSGVAERAEYLSGNVRRKLVYAMDRTIDNPEFQRNVDALKEIIPADIHAEEIAVRMGCPWIDPEDYTKFLRELSGRSAWDTRCEVKYSSVTGEYDVLQAGSRKDIKVNEGTTYGTASLTMYEIAQKILNQRRIAVMMSVPSPKDASKTVSRTDPVETKKAIEKAKMIEAKFSEWIFADPKRKTKYERRYNDLFNSLVGRKYDGSRLTFDGQAADFQLRPHQRDCVARAVNGGNTLAAHVVGAGKSAVFQTAVMKKKQLGLINKACVVVPKPLVEQTAREWRRLYPDARLLTMSAADLSSEAKRDLFAARVATGDYDAVIVSFEQFEKMPMSLNFQTAYLQSQLDDLEDMLREQRNANGNRKDSTTKQIEAAKKKLKVRLENIMNPKSKQKGKDILLDFEQLGFDYLVVDEAHN